MAYADFNDYTTKYYGNAIDVDAFPRLAARASVFLDACTMGRAKASPDMPELKMACCALAEQYQMLEAAEMTARKSLLAAADSQEQEMSSETVGDWARSYRSGGESAAAALKATQNSQATLIETARMYLGNTGLLLARGYHA